jgi:hypothetical protein
METLVSSVGDEPISVATAKLHARYSRTVEDTTILLYLKGVRDYTEKVTRRSFLTHTRRKYFQGFPSFYELERSTVNPTSVVVSYIPKGGSAFVDLPGANIKVGRGPASWIATKGTLPELSEDFGDSVRLVYSTEPEAPSENCIVAMLSLFQHNFQNRSAVELGQDSRMAAIEVPMTYKDLILSEVVEGSLS